MCSDQATGGRSQSRLCSMTPDERWLAAVWRFVCAWLPSAPARVLEIGCGPLGGFVPALPAMGTTRSVLTLRRRRGPSTTGSSSSSTGRHSRWSVWWRARRCTTWPTSATCWTGWARRWRLMGRWWSWNGRGSASTRPPRAGASPGWRRPRRRLSQAGCIGAGTSGPRPASPGMSPAGGGRHRRGCIPARRSCALDARFDRRLCVFGPYFFADLASITEADERAAIDVGQIQATGIQYVGRLR